MEAPDFFVEDLLDLSNGGGDEMITDTFFDTVTGNSMDSSSPTPASDSCNSSAVSCTPSFPDSYFSGTDLCVPVRLTHLLLFGFISSVHYGNYYSKKKLNYD